MTHRSYFLWFSFVLAALTLNAGSVDDQKALSALQQGRISDALSELTAIEQSLGRPTPRVESLKVYAYVALQDWKNARIALTRYKQLVSASALSEAHQALLKLESQIDRGLTELDAKWRKDKEQAEAAFLKKLADAETADRTERQNKLLRETAAVTRLEAQEKSRPPEALPPPLAFADVTDEQIASLASEPAELAGWLEINGRDPAAASLVKRLQDQFAAQELTAPLVSGTHILVGLARETETQVSTEFPVDAVKAAAGQTQAMNLYHAAGRWVLQPVPWSLPAEAKLQFHITDTANINGVVPVLRHGYLPLSLSFGDGLWCTTYLTLPLRQTLTEADGTRRNADYDPIYSRSDFHVDYLRGFLAPDRGLRLMDIAWQGGQWRWVLLNTKGEMPAASAALRSTAPVQDFFVAPNVTALLEQISHRPASAPPIIKIVAGPDLWVALTREGRGPALEWVVVDYLDDPMLELLLANGRKIHLLAGETPGIPQ